MVNGGRELAASSDNQTRGLHNLEVGRKLLHICLLRLLLGWVEGYVERGSVEVFGAVDTFDVLECVSSTIVIFQPADKLRERRASILR